MSVRDQIAHKAISRAQNWLELSENFLQNKDKREHYKYAQLVQHPKSKILLVHVLDQVFRTKNNSRISQQLKFLFQTYGIPEFFSLTEKTLLFLFLKGGYLFPNIVVPVLKRKLRSDTSSVVIDEDPSQFIPHVLSRYNQGAMVNVNFIGELVLGEKEANHRLQHYLSALKDPNVRYLSVKVSNIYSQLHPLSHDTALNILIHRMGLLYRAAIENTYLNEGVETQKFINMDMEEYKDLELTFDVFTKTLEQKEFLKYYGGIVLQAYLPDAHVFQKKLITWAKQRMERGGSPVKMRLVKGANLQMEQVESSKQNWPLPIYSSKMEVDANIKYVLEYALQPENIKAVHLGLGSHNLLDMAYAWELVDQNNGWPYFSFEMLEGLANHFVQTLMSEKKQVLLYTPVVAEEQFLNALSYLVRRLDENTGDENFLKHSFGLKMNSGTWKYLKQQFQSSLAQIEKNSIQIKRNQDRNLGDLGRSLSNGTFHNEPNTDFHLSLNRNWAQKILSKWKKDKEGIPIEIPIQIGNKTKSKKMKKDFFDPNQNEKVCIYSVSLSEGEEVEETLKIAQDNIHLWAKLDHQKRTQILKKVANKFREKRADLIGCMAAVTGKIFIESDVEISEAIDFAEYYPRSIDPFLQMKNIEGQPKGIVLVIAPWNFPTAIPAGGVLAALAAGNSVLLKPAPEAFPVAWEFAQCFWEAGVPKETFQLILCEEGEVLNELSRHPAIDHIIFTGGTDTANKIICNNPSVPISAETGGKNCIIVTSLCDRDQAVKSIVKSAFSNSGQKCSAASLLLLEKELYEDTTFKEKLLDAAHSWKVGSVWELDTMMGPLINPPTGPLKQALELEEDQEWLLEPKEINGNPYLISPGIKWNVKPHHQSFKTELFGPILSVSVIENLKQGISLVNQSEYGLTSGLQSLDSREQEIWKNSIQAGNLYINREITGAIVQRQAFGGIKKSSFGSSIKAGGPNYVSQFRNWSDVNTKVFNSEKLIFPMYDNWKNDPAIKSLLTESEEIDLEKALQNYNWNYKNVFCIEIDKSRIVGEDNLFKYKSCENSIIRIQKTSGMLDCLLCIGAALIAMNNIQVSVDPDCNSDFLIFLKHSFEKSNFSNDFLIENEKIFLQKLSHDLERLRVVGDVSEDMYKISADRSIAILKNKPIKEGRLELLNYLQEQSICHEYHRYGNLGDRSLK